MIQIKRLLAASIVLITACTEDPPPDTSRVILGSAKYGVVNFISGVSFRVFNDTNAKATDMFCKFRAVGRVTLQEVDMTLFSELASGADKQIRVGFRNVPWQTGVSRVEYNCNYYLNGVYSGSLGVLR